MGDIIVKPIDPIASAGSVDDNQPKQAISAGQAKIVEEFSGGSSPSGRRTADET